MVLLGVAGGEGLLGGVRRAVSRVSNTARAGREGK